MNKGSDLKQFEPFNTLSEGELSNLPWELTEASYKSGYIIIKANSPGDAMFLIKSGVVKISVKSGSKEKTLAILEEGDFFGEMSLLDGSPRSASAKALMDTTTLKLERDAFHKSLMSGDKLSLKVLLAISKILSQRLRKIDSRFAVLYERSVEVKDTLERLKSDFLSILSDEFRAPLTIIKASADIMELSRLDQSILDRLRTRIEVNVNRMAMLVDALLNLAEMRSGRMSVVNDSIDLPLVIAEVMETIQPQADDKSQELNVSLPGESVSIYANEQKLAYVLRALLNNAVKYTPRNGVITLNVEEKESHLKFTVADSSMGIPAGEIDGIFDEFYQVDGSFHEEGTGIGLAVAKHIVESHGGSIWVESEEGKGSKFFFTIPMSGIF